MPWWLRLAANEIGGVGGAVSTSRRGQAGGAGEGRTEELAGDGDGQLGSDAKEREVARLVTDAVVTAAGA